jgi:hypothetical protein
MLSKLAAKEAANMLKEQQENTKAMTKITKMATPRKATSKKK